MPSFPLVAESRLPRQLVIGVSLYAKASMRVTPGAYPPTPVGVWDVATGSASLVAQVRLRLYGVQHLTIAAEQSFRLLVVN